MIATDRSLRPASRPFGSLQLPEPFEAQLSNGTIVYLFEAGNQDVVRIEWLFDAGNLRESQKQLANATNRLLLEGTGTHTAAEIAEILDFYGAYVQKAVGPDYAGLSLYCLNKHLAKVLPIINEVLTDAVFPEAEVELLQLTGKQNLAVDLQKVSALASRAFNEHIFGHNHPFGRPTEEADYTLLSREGICGFYEHFYKPANTLAVIVAGKNTKTALAEIEKVFGKQNGGSPLAKAETPLPNPESRLRVVVPKTDALQNALRVGKLVPDATHPDNYALRVLVTLLGGYFGSRLMANIREDKGYTYGIGAYVQHMPGYGLFTISSEVGSDVSRKALDEVYLEISRLQQELIPQEELDTVKQYMQGMLLLSFDGPFALAERFRTMFLRGKTMQEYQLNLERLLAATSDDLLLLANRYLVIEDMVEVVAGKVGK